MYQGFRNECLISIFMENFDLQLLIKKILIKKSYRNIKNILSYHVECGEKSCFEVQNEWKMKVS